MKLDINKLKNVDNKYRAKPFWSLNGDLKKEELKKQIHNMKDMGFGGAFLHSRCGLVTEYMGDEWMDLMKYCSKELSSLGMEAWLYDEDRWPSGTCGGYVTMKKEFRAKSIVYDIINDFSNYKKEENFIALFKIKLNSNNKLISYTRIDDFNNIKEDEIVLSFYYLYMENNTFYNGYSYVDTMNINATKKFLELTHEKYKEKMGEMFNKEIKGIFTDEPHRGPFLWGFSRTEEKKDLEIPYTYNLFSEFYKRKGYKIEDHLPVIYYGKENEIFNKETYDFIEVVEELFLENYAIPYQKWCNDNHIIFTGHILHEDNLASQTIMSGSMMRFYEYMDYPGIDNLGSENYCYNVPSLVSSVKKQLNKGMVLDELYGVSGWPMTFSDYKRIGDWQELGGVTFRCPHLSWYTMKGEAKRDCPASLFHQTSFYKDWNLLEDYYARLSYILENGDDLCDIAIINPIESTWGISNQYTYKPWFTTTDKLYQKLESEYYILFKDLRLRGLSLDYIDEGLFSKYGSVNNNNFICGFKKYKKIIMNGNINLRSTTFKAIKEFLANDGKVVICGDYPLYLDGIKHDFRNELKDAIKIDFDTDKLYELVKDDMITSTSKNVIVEPRVFDNSLFITVLNISKEKENTILKVKTNLNPIKYNLRTGGIEYLDYERTLDIVIINLDLGALEEVGILFSNDLLIEKNKETNLKEIDFKSTFKYELKEDNMLVLDYPKCSVDGEFLIEDYIVNVDRAIRKHFNLECRNNEMVQPWFNKKFYKEQDKLYSRIELEYNFMIEYIPSTLKLMYEDLDNLEIKVNNKIAEIKNVEGSEIDICYNVLKLDNKLFNLGQNTIKVSFDFYEKTDVEQIFLLGNFGVKLGDIDAITRLNETLKSGDLVTQGLPYYGGKIRMYQELQNGNYFIKTEKFDLALINVNGNRIAFNPFESNFKVSNNCINIELSLTRNNSFGIMKENGIRKGIIKQGFNEFKVYKYE